MPALLPLLLTALTCPPGATQKGTEPPAGLHAWCEDKAGRKSGPEREWYEGGAAKAEGEWKSGKMHGAWRAFREDGTLFLDERYVDGEPASAAAPAPTPAPAAATPAGGLTIPEKHPAVPKLRPLLAQLTDRDRKGVADAFDKLVALGGAAAAQYGGSMARRSGPNFETMIARSQKGEVSTTFRHDLLLTIVYEVDFSPGRCRETIAYPNYRADPVKDDIKEEREIDCALLFGDPDVGGAARRVGKTTPKPPP